ncbi:MAG: 4Fe-4S binding protein [Verrucomicrobia bacterium]|nr:4Fe-4S binding protein [Verrucomicrobiota bacterium]
MRYDNQANRIRKEVLIRVAKAFLSDRPQVEIDHIPVEMRPKNKDASRCCIYKDREVLKHRTMAALGFSVEDETDELTPLRDYFDAALQREVIEDTGLTVIDIACSACLKGSYLITNACRGCLGRACQTNCPKDAIDFVNGRAIIDPDRCVNCGLCLKACPYNAIVRTPIPCEEACPVKAISKDEAGREVIDHETCISCGQCVVACPFAAIQERSQMLDVLKTLKNHRPAVALLAPAVVGQFPGTPEQIAAALEQLGFARVEEVSAGADETVRREAAEWKERIGAGAPFMTTSCCPAYIEAVKKQVPELMPFVSHTPSPMAISARWVKEAEPQAVTVFIGPCVAKRTEALHNPDVDYVLTFEELGAMMIAGKVDVLECEPAKLHRSGQAGGRGFPVSGGVTGAIRKCLDSDAELFKPVAFNGLDSKALLRLKMATARGCGGNFVEVMCCEGGCLSGPGVLCNPVVAGRKLTELLAAS